VFDAGLAIGSAPLCYGAVGCRVIRMDQVTHWTQSVLAFCFLMALVTHLQKNITGHAKV